MDYTFVRHVYADGKEANYTKVMQGDRLVAIVRPPAATVPVFGADIGGERPDHWRVDCDCADYEPVMNPGLKLAVRGYVGDDKVAVFDHPNWQWTGK